MQAVAHQLDIVVLAFSQWVRDIANGANDTITGDANELTGLVLADDFTVFDFFNGGI